MLKDMQIEDLYYFKYLMYTKSFNEMAKRYGISQSKVSRAIQRLEKECGTNLIYREKFTKGYLLKESGYELLEFIEYFEASLKTLKEEIQKSNKKQIIIGVPKDESFMVTNKYLTNIYTEELVDIIFEEYPIEKFDEVIELKEVDYCMSCYIKKTESRNVMIFLQDMPVEIVFNRKRKIDEIKDLNNKTIISLKNGSYYKMMLDEIIKENRLNVKIVYSDSLETLKLMIRKNIGIGLSINNIIEEETLKRIDISNLYKMKLYAERKENINEEKICRMKKIFNVK
ncbi:LysR family transcriptional regulator [uncultured Clostridium sp.]|uniref:LysR family transcriptional regulator n=1 Tax=uncultured Clostridium sp. TaxID=59620 RepID=UPI00262063CE|nr:LysR family transcriptional regulator [uncultured Clostridium sp.]